MADNRNRANIAVTAACVFCLAVACYLLSFSGVPISDDEELYASAARNLAVRGTLSAEQLAGNARLAGSYHGVEPAFPAVLSLWYRFFLHTPFGHLQTLYLLPIVCTALSAALVVVIAAQLGFDYKIGAATAMLYALGSMAWPYAKTLFREPLIALLLLGSLSTFVWLVQGRRRPGLGLLKTVLLLVVLALLALTRVVMVVAAVALLIAWLLVSPVMRERKNHVALLAVAGAVLLFALAIVLSRVRATDADMFYRFTGGFVQDAIRRLISIPHSHLLEALAAPLISPWKGLLVYSPICLLGLVSLALNTRRLPVVALLTLSVFCALLIVQALAYDAEWWTPTWGSRFLVPAIPLLAIAALPALAWLRKQGRAGWAGIAAVFVIGVVIQLPAVLFNSAEFTAASYQENESTFPQGLIWNVGKAPLIAQWQAAATQEPDLLLWRTAELKPALVLTASVLTVGVILLALIILGRRALGSDTQAGLLVGLSFVMVMTAVGAILKTANFDPAYDMAAFRPLCSYIEHHVERTDALIVQPYPGPAWDYLMNAECGQGAWYSLPYHAEPGAETLIAQRVPVGGRYWLIEQFWDGSFAAPKNGLASQHDALLSENIFYSPYQLFIGSYRRGPAQ